MRLILSAALAATALDNGLGLRPPMGWRSWNCYGGNVDQAKMESVMDRMAEATRHVDGKNTSLRDLGYVNCGLDDNWQACKAGVNGSFHDAEGNPIVNTKTFPDMKAMTDHAHRLGLRAGWYMNNCICRETNYESPQEIEKHMKGDVAAIVKYGFDGVKLDGCGQFLNLTWWAQLLNETGRPILMENCHWGDTTPGAQADLAGELGVGPSQGDGPCSGTTDVSDCPYNFYRTSMDIKASWVSMFHNLQTTSKFQGFPPLARPGAWSYPDMLEVGRLGSFVEDRAHFGAWCITSAPLVLGHDLNDAATTDRIWPIIANAEAIAVNQAWAGHPGRLVKSWAEAAGRFVWADRCGAPGEADGWQLTAAGELRVDGGCVTVSSRRATLAGRLVELVNCTGEDTQQWVQKDGELRYKGGSVCLDVYNSVGPVVQVYKCNGGKNQQIKVVNGSLRDQAGNCLTPRSNAPVQSSPAFQLWSKPLPNDEVAALVLNTAGSNGTVSIEFSELGMSGHYKVRDLWAHQDLGEFSTSFATSSFGNHDSQFYVFSPVHQVVV